MKEINDQEKEELNQSLVKELDLVVRENLLKLKELDLKTHDALNIIFNALVAVLVGNIDRATRISVEIGYISKTEAEECFKGTLKASLEAALEMGSKYITARYK